MRTAPGFTRFATFSEARITAAEPSPVGQQCQSVNGPATGRDCITSSMVTRLRICASGFSAPWS